MARKRPNKQTSWRTKSKNKTKTGKKLGLNPFVPAELAFGPTRAKFNQKEQDMLKGARIGGGGPRS